MNTKRTEKRKLVSENHIEDLFVFDDIRMILSADKGLGYTIHMYIEEVNKQYLQINEQQHFSISDVDEEWYISSVLDYITQAKLHLLLELSKIITPRF